MNHPIAQFLLLLLAVWMLLVLTQRFLGNVAVLLVVILATVVSVNLYLLRFQRPVLARAYQKPAFKYVIDGICRVSGNQPPIEANEQSPLPPEIMLRDERDFTWAAQKLKTKVIAHDRAIETMVRCLRDRVALRTRSPGSTQTALSSFLVIGPEGIGKRHLAQTLASLLYRDGRITEFDLGDVGYQQNGVAALFGSSTTDGPLLQSVRRFPHQVVLLENIDRAPSHVLGSIQGLLRSGTCLDPRSRAMVSFEHVTLFATISTTLQGLSLDMGSAVDGETWHGQLMEALTADYGLEPTLIGSFNSCSVLADPQPLDRAQVIAMLIRQQCELYGLDVDYVDPEIIAEEVGRFRKSHGFQLVKTRLAGKLEAPILQAKLSHQKQIILTSQSWCRPATKELHI